MRKIFPLIALLIFSAGSSHAYPIFGIFGGMNINGFKSTFKGDKRNEDWNSGYDIGFLYRTDGKRFRLQTSLAFMPKGGKDLSNGINYKLRYVEVAAPFLYNVRSEGMRNWTMSIGAGPYISRLVSAVRASEEPFGKNKKSEKMSIGSGPLNDVKGLDVGVNVYFSYKLDRFLTSISYDYGLANISTKPDMITKNRTFAINLGYFIQRQGRKGKETK